MAEERVQRRLAAIMAADVVGYGRLMGEDETGTRARLRSLLAELIDPRIAQDGGRIVKTTGDGILVEFGSAVDAVRSALAIQSALAERNAKLPGQQRLVFRVGINLGDVIIEEDDIHGDGVNVAARLEGLCQPGEVYVSGTVRDHVEGKVAAAFDDLGEQALKNISKPTPVYRASAKTTGSAVAPVEPGVKSSLPDRPSIAVLPFENMSGDTEQDYFADGIAEDIITALSRFRWFFVIARNSSFTYKGRNVDTRQIGRELGVRYVLEGSVRRGGSRLRITAQLVEAATGNHLWAERYEGTLEDVFDLQDQITEGVAGAVEPSVRLAEIERARRKRPESLDAYDLYLRGLQHAWSYAPAETEDAIAFLEAALQIDPGYTAAHGLAAWFHGNWATTVPGHSQGSAFVQNARSRALKHARAVLGPDTDDSLALAFSGFALALHERDYDVALDAIKRALALTPNAPMVLSLAALVEAFAGQFKDAITHAKTSLRLSPFDPMRYTAELATAYGYFFTEHYDEASEAAQRSAHVNPQFVSAVALLVASRTRGGHTQAAQSAAERLLSLSPDFRIGDFIRMGRFASEWNEIYAAALREAGLPE